MNAETNNENAKEKVVQGDKGASEETNAGSKFSHEAFESMSKAPGLSAADKDASLTAAGLNGALEISMGEKQSAGKEGASAEKSSNATGIAERAANPAQGKGSAERVPNPIDSKGAEQAANSNESKGSIERVPNAGGDTPRTPDAPKFDMEAFQRQLQEARDQQRQENINSVVDSVVNNGQLPENFSDMLREFQSRPNFFGGAQGDAEGLRNFVNQINDRLKAVGSDLQLDVKSIANGGGASHANAGDAPGSRFSLDSIYSRWTDNHVNLRDRNGKSRGHATVITDVVPRPDVRF